MSISVQIHDLLARGDLTQHRPALSKTQVKRELLVSKSILSLLYGPFDSTSAIERANQLRADLDAFVEGTLVSISLTPYHAGSAFLGLLAPEVDGIWDLRSRTPSPGIRLLGGFAKKDQLVALTWKLRRELKGRSSREWRDAIQECKTEWQRMFLAYAPLIGDDVSDYLSAGFYRV